MNGRRVSFGEFPVVKRTAVSFREEGTVNQSPTGAIDGTTCP